MNGSMADIDGWHARDTIAPLCFKDNTELHTLIRKRLTLPYLTGSFHPSFIDEYAGGLLMEYAGGLQKQDGGIRPILRFYGIRFSLVNLQQNTFLIFFLFFFKKKGKQVGNP
jgi:hypothetical protein